MAKLTEKQKKDLLFLKPEDITFSLLLKLFADNVKKENEKVNHIPALMQPTDSFDLLPNEYFNKTRVTTTAGQFIFNKLIIERDLKDVLGYINKPIDKKELENIENILSKALLNDSITVEAMTNYFNRLQWLSMQFHAVICGSFTMNTLKPNKDVISLRDKLIKANREKLKAGDVITAANIEKDVLALANQKLSGDTGLDLYKSGARGSFNNNFKNISAMKGSIFNPTTGKFDIVESNFMEGIRKEELAAYGNAIITGAYPKAIGTAVSGYFSKQIIAALQAITLDKSGSNCGTKGYLNIIITKENQEDFIYRYIIEGTKLILLDDKNITNYIGKQVKMRSPMYCIGDKLCSICAGKMYEKLDIVNIGLTAARISSTLLNLSMKKFHDTSSKLTKLNINELVI